MLATALAALLLCAAPVKGKAKKPKTPAALVVPAPAAPAAAAGPAPAGAAPETAHELGGRVRTDLRGTINPGRWPPPRLARARLEARYQYENWLRAVVELDLGPVPPAQIPCQPDPTQNCPGTWAPVPKDIYVRVGRPRMGLRAGHIKPPTSAVELESSWDLPLVRRGWLNNVLEAASVAGRRLGIQGELRLKVPQDLELHAGAFALPPNPEVATTLWVTSLAGRAELDLGPLALGAFAQAGVSNGGSVAVNGGVDAVAEWKAEGPWAVRAWADLVAGNYPQFPLSPFVAGRAIAAVRMGGREAWAPYAEVFATVQGVSDDRSPSSANNGPLIGGGGGVAAGLWDLAKLTLQAEGRSDGEWALHAQLGASLEGALRF